MKDFLRRAPARHDLGLLALNDVLGRLVEVVSGQTLDQTKGAMFKQLAYQAIVEAEKH